MPSCAHISVVENTKTAALEIQKAFRENEKGYETLFNSISDGIIITDKKGTILFINSSAEILTEWKMEEMIGKSVEDLFQIVDPKTGHSIRSSVQYIIRKGFPFALSDCATIITKNKKKMSVHGQCQSISIEGGKTKKLIFIFQCAANQIKSLSQQKSDSQNGEAIKAPMTSCETAGRDLIQERDLLCALLDNVPDFISFKDTKSRFIRVNRAEAKHLSLSDPQEAVGKTDFHFLPQEYAQSAYEAEQAIIQSGKPMINHEVCIHNDSGGKRYFLSTKVPVKNASNVVAGLVGITRDITERKQFENALRQTMKKMQQMVTKLKQSNAELQQFAFISSHDLQEPLRMVSIYVQLLADRYKGKLDADADTYINFAVEGVKHMQNLIKDLLLYSQIGSTSDPLKPIKISKVLDHVLEGFKETILQKGALITCDALPAIVADPKQMILLFENLIDNALKFNKKRIPKIHVGVKQANGEWVFSVRDNGIGIESQYFDHIFKPFCRVHHSLEYAGTGIGLSICRKIVDHHSGNIWVESKSGKGAKFYFTIPSMGE